MTREQPARLSWWTEWGLGLRILWLPMLPAALIVAGAYALWLHAERVHERTLDAVIASEAGRVREELLRVLDGRATALQQFVSAHPAVGLGDTTGLGLVVARSALPFRALVTIDTSFTLRGVIPTSARIATILPADDETRAVALRAVTDTPPRGPVLVATAPLGSGGRELLTVTPVSPGRTGAGFVVGVERERDLLDETLARSVRAGFSVGVYEGADLVYGTRLVDGGPGIDNAREDLAVRDAVAWRIQIWPAQDLSRELDAHAPLWILGLGTLLAFFVSLSIYLWREGADTGADGRPAADPPHAPAVVEEAALEDPARSAE